MRTAPTRHRLTRLILFGVVALFASAAILMAVRLFEERDSTLSNFRRGSWVAIQAEAELLRLQRALASYRAAPTEDGLEEARLRAELFWSRLPLILHSEDGRGIRAMEGVTEEVAGIERTMPQIEQLLSRTLPPVVEPAERAQELVDDFADPLRDIVRHTLLQDSYVHNRERLEARLFETFAVFGVLLLAGGALVFVVLRQDARTRGLYLNAKRAEDAAQEAERRLASAIDGASEGILLLDSADRVLIFNRRYRKIYPPLSNVLKPGAPFSDLIEAASRSKLFAAGDPQEWAAERTARLRSPGAPWEQRLTDGRTLLVSERRTADGGLVAVHTDITEVKNNATRLLRLEQANDELIAAIEAAGIGVLVCDPGKEMTPIRRVNGAFVRLTGYAEHEVKGRDPRFLQGAESDPLAAAAVRDAVRQGVGVSVRLLNRRKDGSRFWNDMTVVPMRANDGSITSWIGLVTNADEKVLAEEERAELTQRFHRAEKMAAVGQLAGGIAHDFNNLLAVVMGFSELLTETLDGPDLDMAERILSAGMRGRGLVQQILAFSRRGDTPQIQTVDLRAILHETVRLLRATIPQPTELLLQMNANPAVVMGDPVQFEQILMNLCINARDALARGSGQIRIELDALEAEAAAAPSGSRAGDGGSHDLVVEREGERNRLRVGLLQAGPYVRLRVADNGCGMDPETLGKAFQAFFTTKEPGYGTGLGLATVKALVTRSGGAIEVSTEPAAGTSVSIFLPQVKQAAQEFEAPEASPSAAPAGAGRILVVDDEPDILDLTLKKLRKAGYEAVAAQSAEAALELFVGAPSSFAAVLTDRAMPGGDGVNLAHVLSGQRPDLPILLCTGYNEDLDAATLAAAGVTRLLNKPCDRETLLAAIEEAIKLPLPAA